MGDMPISLNFSVVFLLFCLTKRQSAKLHLTTFPRLCVCGTCSGKALHRGDYSEVYIKFELTNSQLCPIHLFT